jgi:hypothetical protein
MGLIRVNNSNAKRNRNKISNFKTARALLQAVTEGMRKSYQLRV